MAIGVTCVQHKNGGFFPGIILSVDPMLLPSGNPFKCHEEVLSFQPMIPAKRFDIFPPWGMLRRSRCVQIFLQTYNLYRERNCCMTHIAKATDVFSSHDCIFHVEQPPERVPTDCIYIFDSLLAASAICCHRGRHRCDTVIHACLRPARGPCLKADLNFCVRPSGARLCPQHMA